MEKDPGLEQATVAAGCFWDVEAEFRRREGVIATSVGYSGGTASDPTYDQVSSGVTGHAEAVRVVFDPAVVTYDQLLDLFWNIHDPTRKGPDDHERSVIFYHSPEQEAQAAASRDRLQKSGMYGGRPILTEILPAGEFWRAEECHQQYYEKCGSGYCTTEKYWE